MSEPGSTESTEFSAFGQAGLSQRTESERKPRNPAVSAFFAEELNPKHRSFMEDTHTKGLVLESGEIYLAIFDGHGGRDAARIARDRLHKILEEELKGGKPIKEALTEAYIRIDKEIKQQTDSGAVATTVLIMGNELIVANVGDAMAVLARQGKPIILTTTHNPESERARLEEQGIVFVKDEHGRIEALGKDKPAVFEGRTYVEKGSINVSRALGDKGWEQAGIIPDPDIQTLTLTPEDTYLIFASDGLWDVVSPEEAIKICSQYSNIEQAAEALKQLALLRGSTDNITVCVIKFDPETIKENAQLRNAAPTTPSESSEAVKPVNPSEEESNFNAEAIYQKISEIQRHLDELLKMVRGLKIER